MMVCDLQGHGLKDNVGSALLSFESLIQEEASCQVMRTVKHPLRGPRGKQRRSPTNSKPRLATYVREPLKKQILQPQSSLWINGALAWHHDCNLMHGRSQVRHSKAAPEFLTPETMK